MNKEDISTNEKLKLSGWGKTSDTPDHLQFINLLSIINDDCQKRFLKFMAQMGSVSDDSKDYLQKNIMCTFTKLGKGAYNGDSDGT